MEIVIILYVIWNFFVFSLYGIDKYKARTKKWRISEITLIAPAFMLGSLGALLGIVVFNHKTSKVKFRILVPLAFVFNLFLVYIIKKML